MGESLYLEAEGALMTKSETRKAIKAYLRDLEIKQYVNIEFKKE